MSKRHRVYRAVLHLYPKSFRQHYGEEMVLVLDDLLNEQTNTLGKCIVWLRISSELPFSIAQENIDNLGGKTMNAVVLRKNRRIIAIVVVSLLVAIGIYAATVLRPGLTLRFVNIVYGESMRNELAEQSRLLGGPVENLTDKNIKKNYGCNLYLSPTDKDKVICDNSIAGYTKIKDMGSKDETRTKVKDIEAQLKRQGYATLNNDVTLTSLIDGTYNGEDYSPDAYYQKKNGKYNCVFATQIAYANPTEPAINTMLSCVRSFDL